MLVLVPLASSPEGRKGAPRHLGEHARKGLDRNSLRNFDGAPFESGSWGRSTDSV